jgi:hypothetical protein
MEPCWFGNVEEQTMKNIDWFGKLVTFLELSLRRLIDYYVQKKYILN